MKSELIRVQKISPAIALVTLQRQEKLNAMDDALICALIDIAETLRDDASVKAIVITGGQRMFSAGADISTFEEIDKEPDVNRIRRATQRGVRMTELWQSIPAVTIAAVEGGAVGGGFGLALACDWRVFARNAWAYVPEVKLGLNYGWGTLPRLAALVGPARAKWISILCRRHGAQELEAWGVAQQVSEPGAAATAALALAEEVAASPGLASQMIKQTVNAYSLALAKSSSYGDMDDMLVCMTDSEGKSARAAFISSLAEKGNPHA